MAVTEAASGSQTATISTEHTLATITTPGTYSLQVGTVNMAAGDTTILRIYGKVRSIDAEMLIHESACSDVQADTMKVSHAYLTPHYLKFTLTQTAGTGRAYPWSVYAA
jgi:hypothetical protein